MSRASTIIPRLILPAVLFPVWVPPAYSAQGSQGLIRSEHVRIKISREREWLGRDSIVDLEQCWRYISRVTGGKLPRTVLVEVHWEAAESSADFREYSVSIGMGHPAAAANLKSFLLHNAAREMARLGLAELSRGAALRDENRFLIEGMAEILAREFDLSTKALMGAWVITHFLDRIKPLSLAAMASWSGFAGGGRNLMTLAPGITLLMTCRELYGRERTLKLIEDLRRGGLKEAAGSALKTSMAVLEDAWLKKIRGRSIPEELTVTSEEHAPRLREIVFEPLAGRPGANLQMKMFIQDGANDLQPHAVFVVERTTGMVLQGRSLAAGRFTLVEIPIEETRKPGSYGYRATAVDESGNIRNWDGSYAVLP